MKSHQLPTSSGTVALALIAPEIPQNTGTLMRLSACMGTELHVVGPLGFIWRDKNLMRAGMDYVDIATVTRYEDWDAFVQSKTDRRLVRVTPDAKTSYVDFTFQPGDVLLLGRESDGFSDNVISQTPHAVKIPMQPKTRSLNVAIAGSIVLTEALRQCNNVRD